MAHDNTPPILMVAGEATQRELAKILAGQFTFDAAEGLEEASDLLKSGRYRTAIVDEELADEGWQEIMKLLPEKGVRIPVLICTSEVGGKGIFAESKRDRTFIADVLIRPFSPDIVRARVESALKAGQSEEHDGATLSSHPL